MKYQTDRLIIYIIGGLTLFAIILIFFFAANEQKQAKGNNVTTYAANDLERPKAETSGKFSDLGVMKVKEEKSADFTITNVGSKPLQLFKVTSSCGCTVAKVTIAGKSSPEFGMHSKSQWTAELPKGETAAVKVIYRPYVMPVKGEVTREVYISTNDPNNKLITFSVKAIVD